ncbi:MAG: hypothetical protein FWC27_10270 [Firmicutes bacterium]|nr:hypothetical protein [Bacillota bacterium]
MTSSNWLELGVLLLVAAVCTALWRIFKGRLRRHDGFEGIIEERGKQPARNKLDIDEEIERLESILNRK